MRKPPPAHVHVNGHVLRANRKKPKGERAPPIVLRRGRTGRSQPAFRVAVLDAEGRTVAWVVYTPEKPLGCGAEVYVVCLHGAAAEPAGPRRPEGAARAAQSGRGRAACSRGRTPASAKSAS